MFFGGPEARSWERVYREKRLWIGRDLEVREENVVLRGPLIAIELADHRRSPAGNRMIYLHLAWCAERRVGEEQWNPRDDRSSFSVNVTRADDYEGNKMYVERDGTMDLHLWLVTGYRLLAEGDKIYRRFDS